MKVLVVGATGGTGRATVEELLEGGHEVTAFARHAEGLDLRSPRLHLRSGDVLDADVVDRVLAGHDAVVVALGVNDNPLKVRLSRRLARTPVDVCSRGTRHLIAAMRRQGLRKLVVVSAYGVGETRDRLPLPWRLVYRFLLKEQIADKEIQERDVRESGLDWVIVQPVGLTNRPPQPGLHASESGEIRNNTVPRRNVGRLLAELVASDRFVGHSVAVSS